MLPDLTLVEWVNMSFHAFLIGAYLFQRRELAKLQKQLNECLQSGGKLVPTDVAPTDQV